MLRRKPRKRYLGIKHSGTAVSAIDSISTRLSELYGPLALEKTALRLVRSEDGVMVVRCNLSEIHSILVAIALVDPPMVSLGISGSIWRLSRKSAGSLEARPLQRVSDTTYQNLSEIDSDQSRG